MGGAMAQIRSEGALIQSIDPPLSTGYTVGSGEDMMEHDTELTYLVPQTPYDSPLSGGHTPGSDEGSMTINELTNLCTALLQKVFDLENAKTTQVKEIASLKKRITKLEQRKRPRFLGGSTTETVSTARPNISVARPEDSTAEPKTPPPTTTTLFDDEDVTIFDTLIDVDHELAVRLTLEEQKKYTVKERNKRAAGSSSKHKSPKKQKVNNQDSEDSDEEHRKSLNVVPDDVKAINYETLDVKILIADSIEKRYGGNKKSKKVQRTLLKQQYENFTASRLETLDQTFDRLQKLISLLELHGEVIEKEDINLKMLRCLPSEWKTHALI
nr:hypothetical protein [Tanacetum cinerariifolium]